MSEEQKGIHCYIGARGYGRTIAEENFRLKSVLKEIREYIEKYTERDYLEYYSGYKNVVESEKILEIIDKGIGE